MLRNDRQLFSFINVAKDNLHIVSQHVHYSSKLQIELCSLDLKKHRSCSHKYQHFIIESLDCRQQGQLVPIAVRR